MKPRHLNTVVARTSFFLAVTLGFLGPISGAAAKRTLIYINGNLTATGQNAVIGLVNDGAGNLAPLPGSPYATGGTGVAGTSDPLKDAQWDSDGEVAINAAGTLLFTVNGHSNDFSAFDLNSNGSLSLISGSPFSSGGSQPASIGYKDNGLGHGISMMVIANKASDPFQPKTNPNYTTFQVSATGVPTMNPGSTLTLPRHSSPSQILMPKSGPPYFFGIQYFGQVVASYKLSQTGIMTVTSSLRTTGDNVGAVLHPTLRTLYVTIPNIDELTILSYDASYNLTQGQTLTSPGDAPCWAAMNKTGTRLYTGETLSGSVTVYDTTDAANPVQLQHLMVAGDTPFATHTQLDPTGKFLYVLDRQRVLHVLDVAPDGTVNESRAPYDLGLPDGTVPLGLALIRK
jgi:DNA-binding beta-propeller fold protein YncE